jgi:flagellar biosynthesis repressor protein FlbT
MRLAFWFARVGAAQTPLKALRIYKPNFRINPLLTLIGKDHRESARKHRQATHKGRDFRTAVIDRRPQKRQRRTTMALKVELKPHERVIIGSCVITNSDQRARLLIDGENIPILREKDILTPETANTPAKLIYLAVQLMYISPDARANHGAYFNLIRDLVTAVPSAWPIIEAVNNHIMSGDLYLALKETKKLVAYEKQLLDQIEELQKTAEVSSAA